MPSLEDRERAFTEGKNGTEPYDVWPGDTDRMPPFPFPTLDQRTKFKDWVLIQEISIANTPGELRLFSLGISPGHGYSILESGEFYITFGKYKRVIR